MEISSTADDIQVKTPSRSSKALTPTPDNPGNSDKGGNSAAHQDFLDDSLPCAGQFRELTDTDEPVTFTALTDSQLDQLVVYFNGYPREMFKDALIRLYASCDRKLAEVRADVFARVSNLDGFPYEGHAMKRRLQTRHGPSLAEKLCLDIHTLIAVLRGDDFASPELKELLSVSKRKNSLTCGIQSAASPSQSPQLGSQQQQQSPNVKGAPEQSQTLLYLREELGNIKRIYNENEELRSAQMSELKETISSLCKDLTLLRTDVHDSLASYQARVDRLESVQSSCTSSNKSDIKLLSQDLKTFEFSLSVLTESLNKTLLSSAKTQKNRQRPKSTKDVGCQSDTSVSFITDSMVDDREITSRQADSTLHDLSEAYNSKSSVTNARDQCPSKCVIMIPGCAIPHSNRQAANRSVSNSLDINSLKDFPSLPMVDNQSHIEQDVNVTAIVDVDDVHCHSVGQFVHETDAVNNGGQQDHVCIGAANATYEDDEVRHHHVGKKVEVEALVDRRSHVAQGTDIVARVTDVTRSDHVGQNLNVTAHVNEIGHSNPVGQGSDSAARVNNVGQQGHSNDGDDFSGRVNDLDRNGHLGHGVKAVPRVNEEGCHSNTRTYQAKGLPAQIHDGSNQRQIGRNVDGSGRLDDKGKRCNAGDHVDVPAYIHAKGYRDRVNQDVNVSTGGGDESRYSHGRQNAGIETHIDDRRHRRRVRHGSSSFVGSDQPNDVSSIPTIVTDRKQSEYVGNPYPSETNTNTDVGFLADYVRKRTRRFYLGGFTSSVTERVIALYMKDQGPKVTKINIFRSNHRPPVIRLNVEDDENASLVTNQGFWPDGIVCRPWISKPRYRARKYPSDRGDQTALYSDDIRVHQRDELLDKNPYRFLQSSEVD